MKMIKLICPFRYVIFAFIAFQVSAQDIIVNNLDSGKLSDSMEVKVNELVRCQLDIKRLEWSYNIWPEENKQVKPNFDDVANMDQLRQMVVQNLEMEYLLLDFFGYELTPEIIQNEMDRMSLNTKDSKRLKEMFNALGNDSTRIANCIVKPSLVKRTIFDKFIWSNEIHSGLRGKAQSQIENSIQLASNYNEINYVLKDMLQSNNAVTSNNSKLINENTHKIELTQQEFNSKISRFSYTQKLQEKEAAFIFEELVEQTDNSIKLKVYSWKKTTFNEWFNAEKLPILSFGFKNSHKYTLPKIVESIDNFDVLASTPYADSWKQESPSTPEGRGYHSAVWTGTEMIIWGGYNSSSYDGNDFLQSGGRYNPATDTWAVTNLTNAPLGRRSHKAVWTGTEMIIWGGTYDGTNYTHSGSRYNPVSNSWATISNTNAPSPRYYHTVTWVGNEMIVWGGYDGTNDLNTGARYNPVTDTWTEVATANAPSVRSYHSAIWTGTEMFIFGGHDGTVLSSGSRYNPSSNTWSAINNAPIGRYQHTAVWTNSKMIVWGGIDNGEEISFSGAQYDPNTNLWSATTTLNAPDVRRAHTAVWTGDRMVVWGGTGSFSTSHVYYMNTGGQYDPVNDIWIDILTTKAPNNNLKGYTSIWTGSEMIIWGADAYYLNTGSRYNPSNNIWVATTRVAVSRYYHSSVWTGTEMIIWGGYHPNSYEGTNLNSGGRYSPVTDSWSPTTIVDAPSNRYLHTAIWTGLEMLVWGGSGSGYKSSGARYNPLIDSWVAMTNTGAPTARNKHTAVWTGDDMIVWGGWDGNNNLNTGGRYNIASGNWSATSTVDASTARRIHTAIWTGNDMVIFGGDDDLNYLNTGDKYNPVSNTWSPISNAPRARRSHTAIWTGAEMIVWGGYEGGSTIFGAIYNPSNNSWQSTSGIDSPITRFRHTAIWTGTEMIVWGGYDGIANNYFENSGARYDSSLDMWTPISTINEPRVRGRHTAIWTGDEMIVWGGYSGDYLNTTGTYYPYGEESEIDIQGNGLSILNGDVTPEITDYTSFGSVYANGEIVHKTFTIENTGLAPLNLIGSPIVEITGSNDFTVIIQPPSSVSIGGTEFFTIAFDPSSGGNKLATVSILNNDQDENPYVFQINGEGLSDDIIFKNGLEEMPIIAHPTVTLTNSPVYITYGESTTITWLLANHPSSCTKSGNWSGTLTGNDVTNGSHNSVISNITSSRTYSLQCHNNFGSSVIESTQVIVGNPPTLYWVSANPSTVNTGEDTTITWSVTNDANYCIKSDDWSGTVSPSMGSTGVLVSNISTASSYSLQCFNNFGSSSIKSTAVSVVIPPVLSVLTASPSSVGTGGQTTISWDVSNDATSCIKSGDWSGSTSTYNGSHSSNVYNIYSTSTYFLTCSNSAGSSLTRSVTVNVTAINSPTLNFFASQSTVNSGASVDLIWQISDSPDTCIKSGDWSGSMSAIDITNGSHVLPITNITSTKSYSLICQNSVGNSGVKSVTITVNGTSSGVWPSCSGAGASILNNNEDRTIIANGSPGPNVYNGLYSDIQGDGSVLPWPGNWGDVFHLSLESNKYVASKFSTSTIDYDAKVNFSIPGNMEGPPSSGHTIAISECPGDFNEHLGQARCITNSNSLYWSTKDIPDGPPGFFCELEKNTTYYLNIVDSNNSENNNYSTTDCSYAYCGILATQSPVSF